MSNPLAKTFQEQKSNLFDSMRLHQNDRNEMLLLMKEQIENFIKNNMENEEIKELKTKIKNKEEFLENNYSTLDKDSKKEIKFDIKDFKNELSDKLKEIKEFYKMLFDNYTQLTGMENNQDFTFMQILQSKGSNDTGREKIAGILFDEESISSGIINDLSPEQQKELSDLRNISDADFKIVNNVPLIDDISNRDKDD